MATDVEIGRNLARIRGGMSQKDLADAMRERGFRWSQATVWAVEKGERPLRLSEAQGIEQVTGIHHTLLLATPAAHDLRERFTEFSELLEEIEELSFRSFEEQRRLALMIDWHSEPWEDSESEDDAVDLITRTAVDAAVDGLVRAEAHHRSGMEVSTFPESPDVVPAAEYSKRFMAGVKDRLESERERMRTIRKKEKADGVDQAT